MGSKSRQYKSVQFNAAFNQATSKEQRVFVPAPIGGLNRAIPKHHLPPTFAEKNGYLPTERGLKVTPDGKGRATLAGPATHWDTLISFAGSTSADAKIFGHNGTAIYDLTPYINSASASVSAGNVVSVCASLGANIGTMGWAEVNKSLILVNHNTTASAVRYTTALGKFIPWSATASGDSIHNMYGINTFKSRIYCWKKTEPKFFYGSVDAVLGTLEPFSLGNVAAGSRHIQTFFGMTRDGGAGPDDFATFIMDDGKVVIYQGSDPGDANNWALVGTYQIGRPFGRRSAVAAGAQHYVLCEDDMYVLPGDLQGKKQPSNIVDSKRTPNNLKASNEINGVYNEATGHIIWEDAIILAVNLPGNPACDFFAIGGYMVEPIVFNGRTFYGQQNSPSEDPVLMEFNASAGGPIKLNFANRSLKTAPIPTNSRTNISLYNPIFDNTAGNKVIFKSRILYDYSASADWVTATASGDTTGIWMSGFGTGSKPQIEVAIVSSSATTPDGLSENELLFRGVDITISESGGL